MIPHTHQLPSPAFLPRRITRSFLLISLAVLFSQSANAATTLTWTGGSDTSWSNGLNWGETAPTSSLTTNIANFNSATYSNQPNAGTTSIAGITFGASNGGITISGTQLSIGSSGISMASGSGASTISSPVTLGAAQSWTNNSTSLLTIGTGAITNSTFLLTVAGTGNTAITGVIGSGSGGLTMSGSGTLTLSGANSYTGVTTVSNGFVGIGNATAFGTNTLTLANSATANTTGVFAVGGAQAIGNTVSLTKGGAGVVEIFGGSNALTFNGAVVNSIASAGIANGPTLVSTNTALTTLAGGLTLSNATAVTSGVTIGGPGDITISGNVTFGAGTSGQLNYIGNGTLILSGTNNFGGASQSLGMNAAGGRLIISGATTGLGTGGSIQDPDVGTLVLDETAQNNIVNSFGFNQGGANLVVRGGTAGNTYSAGTYTQSLGTIQFINGGNTITLGSGTTLTVTSLNIDTNPSSSGLIDLSATNSVLTDSGSLNPLSNGISAQLIVKDGTGIGFATTTTGGTAGNIIRYTGATTLPTGPVANGGTGTQSNTVNYSTSGTVLLKNTAGFSVNSLAVDTSGGTASLDLNGQTMTITALGLLMTGSSNATISDGQVGGNTATTTIQQYGAGTLTISARIGGSAAAASLVKAGPGTLILTGSNSYTGATIVDGGALQAVDGVGLSASSNLIFAGGVFQSSGTFTRAIGTAADQVQWSTGGGFAAQGGTFTINIGGGTSTLNWGSTSFVGANQVLVFGSTTADSMVDFQNGLNLASTTSASAGSSMSRVITVIDNTSTPGSDVARISGTITNTVANMGILKNGTGVLELTNTGNSYTGSTIIRRGTLLVSGNAPAGANGVLGNSTSAVLLGDADSALTAGLPNNDADPSTSDNVALLISGAYTVGRDVVVGGSVTGTSTLGGSNITGTSTYTGNITLNRAVTLQAATNGTVDFNTGAWTTNDNALTIGSSGNTGTVELDNAISTSGGIAVNFGTLALDSAFTSGAMTVGSGATLSGTGSVGGVTGVTGGTINGSALTLTGLTTFSSGSNTLKGTETATGGVAITGSATVSQPSGTLTGSVNDTSSGSSNFAGVIAGSGKTVTLNNASGSLTLGGTNTYTGATTISAGTLNVTGSTASGSAVAVNAGALNVTGTVGGSVNVASGATLSGTGSIGALTVTGGSIVNLQDGSTNTLSGTSTLTFNTGTGNGVLSIDVGSGSSSDLLALTGAASLGSNLFTVNVDSLSGASAGTAYTFISASGGLTLADFTAGTLTGTLAGDTVTFSGGGSSVVLTINAAGGPNYYYTGNTSSAFGTASNYNTLATGGTVQSTPLSSTSDVFIAATSHNNVAPTLGGTNASIHSLTFTSDGAGGSVNSTGGQLTVAAGVTDSAGGTSTESVNAPVVLGGDQSFTVTSSGNTLAFNGGISGSHAVTIAGAGKVNFSTDNTYSNGTTVGSGTDTPTLLLTNGHTSAGSATGTGPLTVQAGATIGGDGTSRSSSFAIGGNVMVGNGTDSTSQTTITGTTASTFTNANLTFNLNSANTDSNILNVGNTAITFTDTTLTLNLQGGQIIGNDTQYTLIAGTGGATYGPLTTFTNSLGQLQINDGNLTLAFSNGQSEAYYAPSYLFLSGNNIDVEVVPEPSTWVLVMSGLAMLLFIQAKKRRNLNVATTRK